jgi:hypothetical protein
MGDSSKCRHCGAPITWGKSKNGKAQPLDASGAIHFGTCPVLKKPKPFPECCNGCGSTNLEVGPGKGPHAGSLRCADCGRFIKFLSKVQTKGIRGEP